MKMEVGVMSEDNNVYSIELSPEATRILAEVSREARCSEAEFVKRALKLYAFVLKEQRKAGYQLAFLNRSGNPVYVVVVP